MNEQLSKMTPFIVMEVLERAQQMQREGIDVIHLEVGEPDFDIPESVMKACQKAYEVGATHYTHSVGNADLRAEIATFYQREYGVTISPDRVLVTSGSSPAILMALMCLCSQGSEVLMSNPGYPCYKNFTLAVRANPVFVRLLTDGSFRYDIEDIRKKITPDTRALFFNSPMNPTGVLSPEEDFAAVASLGIPVISDEIYHGLVYGGKAHTMLEYTDNVFVINGFSKRFAMTGIRLGYMIAPEAYMRPLQILQQNLFICASSTAQKGALEALRNPQAMKDTERMRQEFDARRQYMVQRLRQIGFGIEVEPQGAFYVFADARKFTDDSYKFAFEVLENAHVGITPGVDFGTAGEGFVRFSYANSIENIKEGLDRLEQYLKNRKK